MLINRQIKDNLAQSLLKSGKITVLYGPRQVGKTTLAKQIIEEAGLKSLQINADQLKYIDVLSSRDLKQIEALVSGYELLFIDEGQRIPEIGLNLKIIHDELPKLKVIISGSSSFLLSDKVTEALTGRKKVFTLLPVSMGELKMHYNPFELNDQLAERLVFGSYPEVITTKNQSEREAYLREITSSLLYKDILELEQIKYPMKIRDLLRLLAFQIGGQVSINELSSTLKLNNQTVERYLYLLEQSFIIFRLNAFSRNPRKEVSKSQKFFFYDNGIRNAIIENLNPLDKRNDMGQLWENFIIAERHKMLRYHDLPHNTYFWRTYGGTEVDYIEESSDAITAYEIKFSKARFKAPLSWKNEYGTDFHCITKDNYLDYI